MRSDQCQFQSSPFLQQRFRFLHTCAARRTAAAKRFWRPARLVIAISRTSLSSCVAHRIIGLWPHRSAASKRGANHMNSRSVAIFAIAALGATAGSWAAVRAQQPAAAAKDSNAEADDKIIAEVRDHNQIMSNLEY